MLDPVDKRDRCLVTSLACARALPTVFPDSCLSLNCPRILNVVAVQGSGADRRHVPHYVATTGLFFIDFDPQQKQVMIAPLDQINQHVGSTYQIPVDLAEVWDELGANSEQAVSKLVQVLVTSSTDE